MFDTKIALWSGGKDSTVMVDKLLRDGVRPDFIVFTDTLIEFEDMITYINKVKKYWANRYGVEVTILTPNKEFKDVIFNVRGSTGRKTSPANIGKIAGMLSPTASFCEWRRESKIRPLERFLKAKGIKKYTRLVGFTTDEVHRVKGKIDDNITEEYPLINIYKMSELDCKTYLLEMEMENPLYRNFNRTGCRLCPYQSKEDWRAIYSHYPAVWQELKDLEQEVKSHEREAVSYSSFAGFKTCEDMEEYFNSTPAFSFDEDNVPLKDCFCKI